MESMKRVIYILYIPLTQKLETDLYINYLIDNKIDIEYWDVSEIFFAKFTLTDSVKRNFIKKINSYESIKEQLSEIDIVHTLFIPQITFDYRVIKLYKILTKFKCRLLFFARGAIPTFSNKKDQFLNNLKKIYKVLNLKNIYNALMDRIIYLYKYFGFIKTYDVVFSAGKSGIQTIGIGGDIDIKKAEIVKINYFDYDNYYLLKDNPIKFLNYKYCVFLDDNIVYNPDLKILIKDTINPDIYYKLLNDFFDIVEQRYKLRVVIAAHPFSDYTAEQFGKRKFYKYKTNELVKDCDFTLTHYSTSIAYAVLYNKPINLIYINEMKILFYYRIIEHFFGELNCGMTNINLVINDNEKLTLMNKIDRIKYEIYRYKYLTHPESEKKHTRDIVLNHINNYYDNQ
jgi:hypothetical protein